MTIETDYTAATDFTKKKIGEAEDAAKDFATKAVAEERTLVARAQAAIEQAVETTVEAVRENPVAAAAIVGGVAAVAAGAAYGIGKLTSTGGEADTKGGKISK